MLVSKIIEHLQAYHKPDEHLMFDYLEADTFNGDGKMTKEVWMKACELQQESNWSESLMDKDYCESFVKEAERELNKENMKEALALMDDWRDSGMSPGDFLSEL